MTEEKEQLLLDAWLDIAEAMLTAGAEVRRVERALISLSRAYGVKKMNAFTITSNISITCVMNSGRILTQTRRVISTPATDLGLLEDINSLSRECCEKLYDAEEIKKRLLSLEKGDRRYVYYAGGIIAAFAFTLFFGGTAPEACLAGLLGFLVCLLGRKLDWVFPNTFIFNFAAAFLTGLFINLADVLFPFINADKVTIGVIMLLIPGLAITNSMRDMLVGDMISGTMRFIESILWAGSLAIGFISAMIVSGGLK